MALKRVFTQTHKILVFRRTHTDVKQNLTYIDRMKHVPFQPSSTPQLSKHQATDHTPPLPYERTKRLITWLDSQAPTSESCQPYKSNTSTNRSRSFAVSAFKTSHIASDTKQPATCNFPRDRHVLTAVWDQVTLFQKHTPPPLRSVGKAQLCTEGHLVRTLAPSEEVWINAKHLADQLHKFYNQIKKDEMGGTCSTRGRDEKSIQNFVEMITLKQFLKCAWTLGSRDSG